MGVNSDPNGVDDDHRGDQQKEKSDENSTEAHAVNGLIDSPDDFFVALEIFVLNHRFELGVVKRFENKRKVAGVVSGDDDLSAKKDCRRLLQATPTHPAYWRFSF